MRFSTFLSISLNALLVAATITSTTQDHVDSVHCLAFPRPVLPAGGNQTIPLEAVTGMSQALANNTFSPALPADGIKISPASASAVKFGQNVKDGYQICVQNWYFFKTLTVPLAALSDVVTQIQATCCKPEALFPTIGRQGPCQDSKAILTLADGSNIKVVGQDYGDNCCGMWGCS